MAKSLIVYFSQGGTTARAAQSIAAGLRTAGYQVDLCHLKDEQPPSLDGYDGGLLPIRRYVALERLFLAEEDIWPDGRLRQQLKQVPQARLLSLLNVKFIITDKMQDVWIDDVFYDLEHSTPLGEVTLADLPDCIARLDAPA